MTLSNPDYIDKLNVRLRYSLQFVSFTNDVTLPTFRYFVAILIANIQMNSILQTFAARMRHSSTTEPKPFHFPLVSNLRSELTLAVFFLYQERPLHWIDFRLCVSMNTSVRTCSNQE